MKFSFQIWNWNSFTYDIVLSCVKVFVRAPVKQNALFSLICKKIWAWSLVCNIFNKYKIGSNIWIKLLILAEKRALSVQIVRCKNLFFKMTTQIHILTIQLKKRCSLLCSHRILSLLQINRHMSPSSPFKQFKILKSYRIVYILLLQ